LSAPSPPDPLDAGLGTPAPRRDPRADCRSVALIVDDDWHVRELLTLGLMLQGFEVRTAADGREAIEICQRDGGSIAVALVDKRMPQVDGIKTIETIRRITPHIRCWLMTGDGDMFTSQELKAMGAEGFLRKPLVISDVATALRSMPDAEERRP
jgi:DNA-binding NtrC family response regulator